jgi:hypothetical protein
VASAWISAQRALLPRYRASSSNPANDGLFQQKPAVLHSDDDELGLSKPADSCRYEMDWFVLYDWQ